MANGDRLTCGMVPELKWWMQGHTFSTPMRELEIDAYDGILGMDWLAQHSPMTCHWQDKWVKFEQGGHPPRRADGRHTDAQARDSRRASQDDRGQ